jgi:carbon dioxide concentrating mechanism protein CcmM
MEYADERRFRTSSWQSGPSIQTTRESEAIAALESFISQHPRDYVRLIGIDPKAKLRVLEVIVQRPNGKSQSTQAPAVQQSAQYSSSAPASSNYSYVSNSSSASPRLTQDVVAQIRSLLQRGHRIGTEHADKRRFQTSSWQSCAPIQASRESEVFTALETCLAEHKGEYVRLIGIDSKAKQRVLEVIVQRPG